MPLRRWLRVAQWVLVISMVMNAMVQRVQEFIPVIATDHLSVGPFLAGVLTSGEGTGNLIGSAIISVTRSIRYHGRLFVAGALIMAFLVLLVAWSPWFPLSFALLHLESDPGRLRNANTGPKLCCQTPKIQPRPRSNGGLTRMPYLRLNRLRFHYHLDDYTDPWQTKSVLLLHHAAGGNLHRWRGWVPILARHHLILRFDMRGHAGTQPPSEGTFSLQDLAADIAAVLDDLGIEKVHLVGASAGGIISLSFAHDFPQRLHSLSLVASTPRLAQMGIGNDAGGWRRTLELEGTKALMGMMSPAPGSSHDKPGQHAPGSPIVTAQFILAAANWGALSLCLRLGPIHWLSSQPSRHSRAFQPGF